MEWFSGSGPGGQKKNKCQSCCRVIHAPTGLMETRQGRSRSDNQREAKAAILVLLDAAANQQVAGKTAEARKAQVGSGMRGDKTVTIRFQDDKATNHATGKTIKASRYMKGYMDEAW